MQLKTGPFALHDSLLPPAEGVPVVAVIGELDLYTVTEFRRRLFERIDEGPGSLVVDLIGCTFVGSTGCGALLQAARRARGRHGALVVVNTDASIARIFAMMGLGELFEIVETREAAGALLEG